MIQKELNLYQGSWGGRRPNSGRKRMHSPGVAHRKRQKVSKHTPLHINFKYKIHIRTMSFRNTLERAISLASGYGFKVTHYTIQYNHIHLIAEADNNQILYRGMRCVTNTITNSLKKGSIQLERYHLHVLKSPKEVTNALTYVMLNDLKHGQKLDKCFTRKITDGKSWLLRKATSS